MRDDDRRNAVGQETECADILQSRLRRRKCKEDHEMTCIKCRKMRVMEERDRGRDSVREHSDK